ncbi:hypothetical protein DdX_19633 [Ditylenchus destructor]|uniref:F-box domain-containing protein n=1 Tax=Ditylenchus destructor TaxID=166010 RepID=A0AAD4MMU5_9BILA|nr:hypothetical protein DdX_19633 [Ditylenchus destructor]
MSCSKHLPPFTYELLRFLNRDQLERFKIICRPLKNLIERYFHSKPYRVFDRLHIRGGSYALINNHGYNFVQWHPNQDDYSVQQFFDGKKCSVDEIKDTWDIVFNPKYYSFAEMRPYLGPSVRVQLTYLNLNSTYTSQHIEEMESIAHLWRDGSISVANNDGSLIVAEDFQLILNSPTILQCRKLAMDNAHFSFKDYKVLYTVKVIETWCDNEDFGPNCWLEFLEQPGVKPIVALRCFGREYIDITLDRLKQAFFSAVVPNAYKVVFTQDDDSLSEFRETNTNANEILELKKGLPVEYQEEDLEDFDNYTLERSAI